MGLFFSISGLVNAITSTVLGIFVFLKDKKNNTNKTFAFFCFCVAIWSYAYIFWPLAKDASTTLFWFRVLHFGAIYVSVAFLHFITVWLGMFKEKKKLIIFGYILSLFFTLFVFSPLFIKEVVPKFSMRYWANPGILYHFYLLHFFTYAFYAFYLLVKTYKESMGVKRLQARYILIGMIITYIAGSTNYFLWYNINIPPYLNIFASAYVISIAYAITRYQLMDIRIAARKGVVYFLAAVFSYGFFYLTAWILNNIFGSIYAPGALIFGIFIAIIFVALFFVIEKLVRFIANRYFFSALYSQHETLKHMSEKLTTIVDLEKLINNVSDVIKKTLGVDKIAFILKNGDTTSYKINRNDGFKKTRIISLIKNEEIIAYFKKTPKPVAGKPVAGKPVSAEELRELEADGLKEMMINLEARLLLPLLTRHGLQGMIILGDKITSDAYSSEDTELLKILASQTALAIENARLYDEMEEIIDDQTKDIKTKNVKLKKLLKMRTEFLHTASHQLRTPVSAIRGLVSMLEAGDFDDVDSVMKKQVFNGIFTKTQNMVHILDDILIAAELDTADNYKFKKESLEKVDIALITREVIKELQYQIKGKNIEMIYNQKLADSAEEIFVLSDRNTLKHILANILENAVIYTKEGGRVEIRIESEIMNHASRMAKKKQKSSIKSLSRVMPSEQKYIVWSVKDNGIGIPKESQKDMFEKFKRGTNANKMNCDGSGLGLFIVNKLVNAHPCAEIGFKSIEGEGTTFWIRMPQTIVK